MSLFALQSTYTSDPYEPSETLIWGLFSTRTKAQHAFVSYVSSIAPKIEPALKAQPKYPSAEHAQVVEMLIPVARQMAALIMEWARTEDPLAAYPALKRALNLAPDPVRERLLRRDPARPHTSLPEGPGDNERWRAFCDLTGYDNALGDTGMSLAPDSFEIVTYELDQFVAPRAPKGSDEEDDE